MARLEITTDDKFLTGISNGLKRHVIDYALNAGGDLAVHLMKKAVESNHHVGKTGSMLQSVEKTPVKETIGGGEIYVYPQGEDSRGVRNALKAYVINHGLGANPTIRSGKKQKNKTGDKFITKEEKASEAAIQDAVKRAADEGLAKLTK